MKAWVAIFVTLGYSLAFFLFFVFVRETFRYFTFMSDQEHLLVLSTTETNFYNFFFAFIAILTGTSFGAELLIKTQFQIPKHVRYAILNDFGGLQWITNYFVARLGVLFGSFCSFLPIYISFDFYRDYWFLFPMILVVLFLNQWMRYRYFIKNKSLKVMMWFFAGTTIYSLLLCTIPIFDFESFNHSVLKNTINYNYNITLPSSDLVRTITRRSLLSEIYLGYPKQGKTDSAVLAARDWPKPLTQNGFIEWLNNRKEYLPLSEQGALIIGLYADRKIAMDQIKSFMNVLRDEKIRTIYFMTSRFRDGISVKLLPRCSERDTDTTTWQLLCSELRQEIKKTHAIKLRLAHDSLFVNDRSSSQQEISSEVNSWAERYQSNYLLDIDLDDHSSYESFISILDTIHQAIIKLRQKYAIEHFSKNYDHTNTVYQDRQLYDTLSKIYPLSMILLSDAERKYVSTTH